MILPFERERGALLLRWRSAEESKKRGDSRLPAAMGTSVPGESRYGALDNRRRRLEPWHGHRRVFKRRERRQIDESRRWVYSPHDLSALKGNLFLCLLLFGFNKKFPFKSCSFNYLWNFSDSFLIDSGGMRFGIS